MKLPHRLLSLAAAVVAFLSGGCVGNGHKPLETLAYRVEPAGNQNLIIFLRGLGGTWRCFWQPHKCFETEGFVAAVQQRKLPFDMLAPNSHLGYYKDRTLEIRLREDVIRPAIAKGYEKIWLAGVSMGGLGSILYFKKHPEHIAGILLIGPYLGDESIVAEIEAAGGVEKWEPGPYNRDEDWQRMLWDWLKRYCADPAAKTPLYLGIGNQDRYFPAQKLLADRLPKNRVIRIDGGHDALTFTTIWQKFLDKQVLE